MFTADEAVSVAEAGALFFGLEHARGLVLAVSGGPDSTALLWLAAQWRKPLAHGPALIAITVDHGLRPQARAEAAAVKQIAKRCGIAHRMLRWSGSKPRTGLQQAARTARYRLLAEAAARFGADHVLTAHTRDDQAETLMIRMSRGSGLSGLAGMAVRSPLPHGTGDIVLMRPFLDLPKSRLVATVTAAGLNFAVDPSNTDPRFTRVRIRALMPALAREGFNAARLAQLARRLRRADATIEAAVDAAWNDLARREPGPVPRIRVDAAHAGLPAEVELRLLGRAIAAVGDEGPVALGKLEALQAALTAPRLRRTLAGALITRDRDGLTIERAPPRRRPGPRCDDLNHRETRPPQSGQTALE